MNSQLIHICVEWTSMTFGAHIHDTQRTNPNDSEDPLTCHLAPPDGKNFHLSCKINSNFSSVDPYRSSFNMHADDFGHSFDRGSFLTNIETGSILISAPYFDTWSIFTKKYISSELETWLIYRLYRLMWWKKVPLKESCWTQKCAGFPWPEDETGVSSSYSTGHRTFSQWLGSQFPPVVSPGNFWVSAAHWTASVCVARSLFKKDSNFWLT